MLSGERSYTHEDRSVLGEHATTLANIMLKRLGGLIASSQG